MLYIFTFKRLTCRPMKHRAGEWAKVVAC